MNRRPTFRTPWLALLVLTLPAAAFGGMITYTVDPAQSVLTASGSYLGQNLDTTLFGSTENPMIASGFIASYTGTVVAEHNTLANTLEIMGGNIAAQQNGFFSAGPPNAPTFNNYTFFINTFPAGSSKFLFNGAIANFAFSISSPVVASPVSFDASELLATTTSGEVYGELGTLSGSVTDFSTAITGSLLLLPNAASIIDSGNIETLSIGVNTNISIDADGQPLGLNLSGVIIATAVVPEPGGLGILVLEPLKIAV